MKRVIKLTESDLIKILKKVISEQSKPSNIFYAEGTVEDDMIMSFPVTEMSYVGGTVMMNMIDPETKEKLYVSNFKGPIYSQKNNAKKYRSVNFHNISLKNYNQIVKQYNIPFMTT